MTDCGQALIGLASKQANSNNLSLAFSCNKTRPYLFQNSRLRRICSLCQVFTSNANVRIYLQGLNGGFKQTFLLFVLFSALTGACCALQKPALECPF